MRLILDKLIDQLQQVFRTLPDPRNGQNTQYRFCDVPMAAFFMFHIQSPSFLQYQTILQEQTQWHLLVPESITAYELDLVIN